MKWAYYNEWEPYCAEWLRKLIVAGMIPAGDVDERDIREVTGDDLKGYAQVHLFAGIGGWAYAGRLAGIPDNEPIWTGSCPCQPLSSAGQRKGHADERHLWPAFHALIAERRPAKVFGEQVASKDGREWLAGVRADLEHLGYAVGAADLPAAGVGSPQIRQRLWWVANAKGIGRDKQRRASYGADETRRPQHAQQSADRSRDGGMADANADRARQHARELPGNESEREERAAHGDNPPQHNGPDGGLAGSLGAGLEGRQVEPAREERAPVERSGGTGFWSDFDLMPCADGKARRVEPGTFPLAHGVPARVGKLRAYGNAIGPQVAAEFMMVSGG